uniref:Axin 1 n=1 Tax=Rousettus aegyptiacus TaxID=9407 RepID=A0A7J8EWX6_ROUAE|nr:axin 1 [Rousettus aegyptiacus]
MPFGMGSEAVIWSLPQPIGGGSLSCSLESRFFLPATQWPRAGTRFLEYLKVLRRTAKPIMADRGMVGRKEAHGARQVRVGVSRRWRPEGPVLVPGPGDTCHHGPRGGWTPIQPQEPGLAAAAALQKQGQIDSLWSYKY